MVAGRESGQTAVANVGYARVSTVDLTGEKLERVRASV